jgi:hypothetical protein
MNVDILITVGACVLHHNMPPRRAAASAAAPKTTRSSRGRAIEAKGELGSEGEIIGAAPPKTATKRTSSAKSSAKARNRGRETVSEQIITEQSSEGEDAAASENSEPPPTKRPGRPRSAPGTKATRKSKQPTISSKKSASSGRVETVSEDEGEVEHDTLEVHQPKPKSNVEEENSQPPGVPDDSLHHSSTRNRVAVDSTEKDSDDVGDSKQALEDDAPEPVHDTVPAAPADPLSEDEEDLLPQVSLRASAAPPSRVGHTSIRAARSSLRRSVLPSTEIETGPKSRLVIHKMALVNFKSYKGRQEIGPFHKVGHGGVFVLLVAHVSLALSHFQPSLALTAQANQTPLMPCCSSLGTAQARCDKGNFLSLFITLSALQRPNPGRKRRNATKATARQVRMRLVMMGTKAESAPAALKCTSEKS